MFSFLDSEADAEDLDEFFELWNKQNKSNIEHFLLDSIQDMEWQLMDLWVTQYLREDKLESALEIYETIPDTFWTHRDTFEMVYHYSREFTSDPF